ncbi:hypothetical protein ACFRFJ_16205 [Streptomyces hydrogenans]|uniref:hypothetical protein n=1 Tax=Streptomyces hydrogenans TaxID=1873719 RepID=UPI0036B69A78
MTQTVRERLARAAHLAADLALQLPQLTLVLGAGAVAGTYTWHRGYTLPFLPGYTGDAAVLTAALVVAALVSMAVNNLTLDRATRIRYALLGRPLGCCPECGGLAEPPTGPAVPAGTETVKENAQ